LPTRIVAFDRFGVWMSPLSITLMLGNLQFSLSSML
jgi:hypothetical protein